MRERQTGKILTRKNADPEQNLGDVREALEIFRNAVHAAAERPDFFWKKQHTAIMSRLNESGPGINSRPKFLWVSAAAAVLLCLFFFAQTSKAPTPDLPAGSDQNLLVEIERALSQEYPEALAPAASIENKNEQTGKQQ
jgi:hypothetical protein